MALINGGSVRFGRRGGRGKENGICHIVFTVALKALDYLLNDLLPRFD